MVTKHLDEEALLRASYGVPASGEAAHLAACGECAAAIAALDARRQRPSPGQAADAVEQLPEAFWRRQREAILACVQQPAAPLFHRAAAGFSLAILLLLALLVVGRPSRPPAGRVTPASSHAPRITPEDEQLLLEIHFLLNRPEPRALAPAVLLVPNPNREVSR